MAHAGPPATTLDGFTPAHDFYVGIDSDGCVFDSMEIKHKECFCPAFIDHYDLQPAAKYAREVWEFVNLYSQTRGINRFQAVLLALDLCRKRRDIVDREVAVPKLPELAAWVGRESKLGNPQLAAEIDRTGSRELDRVMAWSNDVNAAVKKIVRNVPPFPGVRRSLERLHASCDVTVVSQTPTEALLREWAEQHLEGSVSLIAGQELGTKGEHLAATAGVASTVGGPAAGAGAVTSRYPAGHVLMIGDAPGDLEAARSVGALFYPVLPGREEASWRRFADEAIDRFLAGSYSGAYERELVSQFEAALPATPAWEVVR